MFRIKTTGLILLMLTLAQMASAQMSADFRAYIERYKTVALQHESAFGIPASITLAQGLLESGAGHSGLAINGNNHFGIKDFSWHGDVVCYGDSTRRTCYRKYGSAEDSFLDHARFLKGKRYGRLYELDITDYRGWAQGLRDCGYAEDPAYPQKLINIIEQYKLNELTAHTPRPHHYVDTENATEEELITLKEQERLKKQAIRQAREAERQSLERRKKEKHERVKRERAERYAQHHAAERNTSTRFASADND
ncbi:MAG: glucosaminidase domain-containing protein [Muribaculaceae bacterium]|nr:glucosaminidase domain-containing protein [Muribaculaceae bacterium]